MQMSIYTQLPSFTNEFQQNTYKGDIFILINAYTEPATSDE